MFGNLNADTCLSGLDSLDFCTHLSPDAGTILLVVWKTPGGLCPLQWLLLRILYRPDPSYDFSNSGKKWSSPHGLVRRPAGCSEQLFRSLSRSTGDSVRIRVSLFDRSGAICSAGSARSDTVDRPHGG